jgi:DNA repair exonuclease SbcCD ATPase subunit
VRIVSAELSGFRAFAKLEKFDFDADSVIVVGPNGQGKTSLFDGILWALTGKLARLKGDNRELVSIYSESGTARVALTLADDNRPPVTIVRSFDGIDQRLQVDLGEGEILKELKAKSWLVDELWPQAAYTSDAIEALGSAITRSVYLQQDCVRQFVEADSDDRRFDAISELVGAGRVTDLQSQLDRERDAWSRATNVRVRDVDELRSRLTRVEAEAARIARPKDGAADIGMTWTEWWSLANKVGIKSAQVPAVDSAEAPQVLDSAIKELQNLELMAARRQSATEELLSEIMSRKRPKLPAESTLAAAVESAKKRVENSTKSVAKARKDAAAERRRDVDLTDLAEEMAALAKLALRHLDSRCPVCGQQYDKPATRLRLEELAQGKPPTSSREKRASSLKPLAARLEARETELGEAEAKLHDVQSKRKTWQTWETERDRRLADLGVKDVEQSDVIATLRRIKTQLDSSIEAIRLHRAAGERQALVLAQASEAARKHDLEKERDRLRSELQKAELLLSDRKETGAIVTQLIEALRDASSEVVGAELERIQPLLQQIYATVDPHPALRVVEFLTRMHYGKGRMETRLVDPMLIEGSTNDPAMVLSSSQMNVLAVSIFLALNLGVPNLPLKTVILDDPLQSLDDINLLGLIDLLRRVREQRQLLLSTHDARFGQLLVRKLRPIGAAQHTKLIEIVDWGRTGPVVRQTELDRESKPLRIVA